MPDIKHPTCIHPKFGAKMQRLHIRILKKFLPWEWLCPECNIVSTGDDQLRKERVEQIRKQIEAEEREKENNN